MRRFVQIETLDSVSESPSKALKLLKYPLVLFLP